MNTIIIHPNNRIARTPEHDLSDILIAPVSRWYRKPTPWWVDTFEEVGLHPIVETDEIVEEVEDPEVSLDEIVLDDVLADELSASENVEYTSTDIAPEHLQQGEYSIDAADIDIVLDDIIFDNGFHDMEKDGCYDNIDIFEEVILVDEIDNDDEEADDDDDTLMNITFTGKNATFRLQASLSIVATELDSEDEGEDDTNQCLLKRSHPGTPGA